MLMSMHTCSIQVRLQYLAMSYFLVVSFLRSSPHLLVRSLFNLSGAIPGYFILQYSKSKEKVTYNTSNTNMLSLLKTAVLMVWFIPDVAEQAASLALEYQMPIRFLISPVAVVLLDCSKSSKSTNFTYTPKSFTSSLFWNNEGERIRY